MEVSYYLHVPGLEILKLICLSYKCYSLLGFNVQLYQHFGFAAPSPVLAMLKAIKSTFSSPIRSAVITPLAIRVSECDCMRARSSMATPIGPRHNSQRL